jgi:hypothetical protein
MPTNQSHSPFRSATRVVARLLLLAASVLAAVGIAAGTAAPAQAASAGDSAVSAGGYHTCAICSTDGSIACWGGSEARYDRHSISQSPRSPLGITASLTQPTMEDST